MNKKRKIIIGIAVIIAIVIFATIFYVVSILKDSDDDGFYDYEDDFGYNPTEWSDSDGDGHGDNSDDFRYDRTQWSDSDDDGYGDNQYGNNPDFYPNNPNKWKTPNVDLEIIGVEIFYDPSSSDYLFRVNIRNNGDETASGFSVYAAVFCAPGDKYKSFSSEITNNGYLLGNTYLGFINHIQSLCSVPLPVDVYIEAFVDAKDAIDEFDENNNNWTGTVTIHYP